MSKVRTVNATIQAVDAEEEFIFEIQFFEKDGRIDRTLFKTYNAKDAYILARIMEICEAISANEMIDKEVRLVLVNRNAVAISGTDDSEFYPLPSSELYYEEYDKLEYTKDELKEALS